MSEPGWTLDTLRVYLEARIEALDRQTVTSFEQNEKRVDLALAAADRAMTKAETATEKRFDGVNEFRGALQDQATHLMPRAEYTVQHGALTDRVVKNEGGLTRLEANIGGRGEGFGTVGVIILVVATALSAVSAIGVLIFTMMHK